MSKKNKQRRTFTMKQRPTETIDGITNVYPFPGAISTRVVAKDEDQFMDNPKMRVFMRPYIPGELTSVPLPDDMRLEDITHIRVQRLGNTHQVRLPLDARQALTLMKDNELIPKDMPAGKYVSIMIPRAFDVEMLYDTLACIAKITPMTVVTQLEDMHTITSYCTPDQEQQLGKFATDVFRAKRYES